MIEVKFLILQHFSPVDVFTGDSILLNKLKQDLGDEDGGEEIKIDCVPQINMGRFSTKNDPTGTVTYEMIVDETRVDTVFEQKKDYLNAERIKKDFLNFLLMKYLNLEHHLIY